MYIYIYTNNIGYIIYIYIILSISYIYIHILRIYNYIILFIAKQLVPTPMLAWKLPKSSKTFNSKGARFHARHRAVVTKQALPLRKLAKGAKVD